MPTSSISFKNFRSKKNNIKLKQYLKKLFLKKNHVTQSMTKKYQDKFDKKIINKYQKYKNLRLIGMGGSILGTKAIFSFMNHKIKKNFLFVDNLNQSLKKDKKKYLNIIVSKSGNTIETIANSNILIKKKEKNIFITENKQNYLNLLAQKLKADVIYHNNFIGGRYSVLSEVGMLPAELMGLNPNDFRQLNSLIKNKKFLNSLIRNVSSILYFLKEKRFNSVILNYDDKSNDLFNWYQQLVAESLGKNKTGLLPIISCMPKDNHSVMQLYLDGFQNNFFTFFYVNENRSQKIDNNFLLGSQSLLYGKDLSAIVYSQKKATENVFRKKNIPFRSFEIKTRNEKTLGELFCFFILETILLGQSLKLNPYDQPAVELIKKETKRQLIK